MLKNWLDLEARFRTIAPRLQGYRLDIQLGAVETFRLVGGHDREARMEFELLSRSAGKLLKHALPDNGGYDVILGYRHPPMRWYRALKELSHAAEPGTVGFQIVDGREQGIYNWTINNIGDIAANVCLDLQGQYPIRPSRWERYHGKEITLIAIGALVTQIFHWLFE